MKKAMAMRLIRFNHRDEKKSIHENSSGDILVKTADYTYRYNFNNGILTGNGYTYTEADIEEMINKTNN